MQIKQVQMKKNKSFEVFIVTLSSATTDFSNYRIDYNCNIKHFRYTNVYNDFLNGNCHAIILFYPFFFYCFEKHKNCEEYRFRQCSSQLTM